MVWGINPEVLQRILPSVIVNEREIAPEPPAEKIPNPPEITVLQESVKQEPDTLPQSTTVQKEELILQNETEEPASQPASPVLPIAAKTSWKINLALVLIFWWGPIFDSQLNSDQNQHQHPDERFISMTAEQISAVNSIGAYFDTQNSS